MSLRQEQFYTDDVKRVVFVAEDDEVNRELIGFILKDDYKLIFANDGKQAISRIRKYRDEISLILLDFYMPFMTGIDVFDEIQKDEELKKIPVILMTGESDKESEALKKGVVDFISKPFSHADVLKLRVKINIELTERRKTISSTERDFLTGLYTRDFFYSYVDDFNKRNRNEPMDALVLDVDRFHLINERYGVEYGDKILCAIADNLKKFQAKYGAILCRRISDTFLVYTQSGKDYQHLIETLQNNLSKEGFHVHVRLGAFNDVDKNEDMVRQFTHAKMAADMIRGDYTKSFAVYDNKLRNEQLYREQLIEDFYDALSSGQFEVYYQPKYNIQSQEPYLASAEALVRWKHPQLGMVGPNDFIKLFEENGLIRDLDCYVWDNACRKIAYWKKKFGVTIPVSVNVSRIDMMSNSFLDALNSIVSFYELNHSELMLEITESAFVNDTDYVVNMTRKLRESGYLIGMDDFGTGYSSLGMIADMPIDALKLDRSFIVDALKDDKNRKLLKMMMDIADSLSAVTVAEGVETRQQLDLLKSLGCDIIQGYYFSKPLRAIEFEHLVKTRAAQLAEEKDASLSRKIVANHMNADHKSIYHDLAKSLSSVYDSVYYVDLETDNFIEYTTDGGSDHMRVIQTGVEFFDYCQLRTREYVSEKDKERIIMLWHKDYILKQLKKYAYLSVNYSTSFKNEETEFEVKIIPAFEGPNRNLIVAMKGIDQKVLGEIRNKLKHNDEVFNFLDTDQLTGTGNRLSFIDRGIELDEKKNSAYGMALFEVIREKQILDDEELANRDEMILKIVKKIKDSINRADVYRIAPDEVALIYSPKQEVKLKSIVRSLKTNRINTSNLMKMKNEQFRILFARVYKQLNKNREKGKK